MFKGIITFILLNVAVLSFAQEDQKITLEATKEKKQDRKETFTFEIVADSYYKKSINSTDDSNTTGNTPPTSFADKPGFALGMVNAIATYTSGKVRIVADIVEGPRGEAASKSRINQLYVRYSPIEKLDITFGKFNTFLGYEVISPKDDFNYSTSYLFSNGPFSHTGLKARYHFSDKQSLVVALMNANDDTKFNSTNSYTLGMQYSLNGQNLNMIYGDRDTDPNTGETFEIDFTGGIKFSEKFFLGINTSYETTQNKQLNKKFGFYGVALYGVYEINPKIKLGLRPEYFTKYLGAEQSVSIASTLSANWAITKSLMLIPELRLDYNKDEPFVDSKLRPQSSLSSFLVGVVFHFDRTF